MDHFTMSRENARSACDPRRYPAGLLQVELASVEHDLTPVDGVPDHRPKVRRADRGPALVEYRAPKQLPHAVGI
jgi:hypothetical protein